MDLLEIIKSENQRVRDLFIQLKDESGRQQRRLLFDNIRRDLDLHLFASESVVYPAIKNFEGCERMTASLYHKHREIRDILNHLGAPNYSSIEFENRIAELINHFDDYVTSQEGELFEVIHKI